MIDKQNHPKPNSDADDLHSEKLVPSPQNAKLLYQIRVALHKIGPFLIEHPDTADLLAEYQRTDAQKNLDSSPPPGEMIELRGVWGVEFYTPAHIPALVSSMKRLGWHADPGIGASDPVRWLQQLRQRTETIGWLNLGRLSGEKGNLGNRRTRYAPLPENTENANATIFLLTPSLVCLLVGFEIDERSSGLFQDALCKHHSTSLVPNKRGHRIIEPWDKKADEIESIRAKLRHQVSKWFGQNVPGVFASGLSEHGHPTCEFLTFSSKDPFPEKRDGWKSFLNALNMNSSADSWSSSSIRGLKFASQVIRDADGIHHSAITILEADVDKEQLSAWGYPRRSGLFACVYTHTTGLIAHWAGIGLLTGYTEHLNALRDAPEIRSNSKRSVIRALDVLRRNIAYNVDIAAVTSELVHFTKNNFDHQIEPFVRTAEWRRKHRNETVSAALALNIRRHAIWLRNTEAALRSHLTQYASLMSSLDAVRVQRSMRILTVVILFLTISGLASALFPGAIAAWLSEIISEH